jgi:hypothetical protein
MEARMSDKASKVLMIAVAVSALALPMISIHANASEVRINQVSSNASNGDGIGAGLFGSLIDKVVQTIKDRKANEESNRRPIRD